MLEQITAIIERLKSVPGALLPILHEIQATLNHIPEQAIPLIAHGLNLSRAEVHGVVSFYHYFRSAAAGRYTIHLCRAEACQAMGARALEAHIKRHLDIDFHQTSKDGLFSLEPVYCLGNCACAPSLMINQDIHGRVSADSFDALIHNIRSSTCA